MQEVVVYTPSEKAFYDLLTFCFTNPKETLIILVVLVCIMVVLNKIVTRR